MRFVTPALATFSVALMAASPDARASLITFGFDGFARDCSSCLEDLGVTRAEVDGLPISARFTIDTDAVDANPDPEVGQFNFAGSGPRLAITLGDLTLFANGFTVNTFNDNFGGFCGAAQRRDLVTIFSDLGWALFDSCSLGALANDSLFAGADLPRWPPQLPPPVAGSTSPT